jgi:hypothetical protein
MPSISLNSNFYDFWVKFHESWYLFIPNLARVISNFTKLLVDTFSFMKFTSIKILFTFSCLFIYIYINTWTKHFNSDSRIYHHSYNLIYHFPSFFVILTFININNIIRVLQELISQFAFLICLAASDLGKGEREKGKAEKGKGGQGKG